MVVFSKDTKGCRIELALNDPDRGGDRGRAGITERCSERGDGDHGMAVSDHARIDRNSRKTAVGTESCRSVCGVYLNGSEVAGGSEGLVGTFRRDRTNGQVGGR